MLMIAEEIINSFLSLRDDNAALHLARFFKTGKGEYGYGDKFLGLRVPVTRNIVKKYKDNIDIESSLTLIRSEWHEIRLAGFLFFIELYRKAKKQKNHSETERIVRAYIQNIQYGNNWDLVDLTCQYILGDWFIEHSGERYILDQFAEKGPTLWHQRVAIVSTLALIRSGQYEDTIRISKKLLSHKHDLIHKATGWMLREMGKRGGYEELIAFLDEHAAEMPRTALRYAIERFPIDLRQHYLKR